MTTTPRMATSQEITKTLITLFSVLPPKATSGMDSEAVMAGYLVALEGVSAQALKATAMAIIQGEIDEISTKVCPLPPELSRAVRKRMLEDHRKAQLETPRIDYTPQAFVGIEMRIEAAKQLMWAQGRTRLCFVDSAAHAQELAKHGDVPPGSLYVGILGAFYGPVPGTGAPEIDRPENPVDDSRDGETLASGQL